MPVLMMYGLHVFVKVDIMLYLIGVSTDYT